MLLYRLASVGCLMWTAASAPCGGLPCSADMPDGDEFHGGSVLPSARIPCDGGDIILDPATNSSFKGIVMMAVDQDDLFTSYMTSDGGSLSKFFNISSRPDVTIIFAAWSNQTRVDIIRSSINKHISALNVTDQSYWRSHIKYATETIVAMNAADPSSRDPTKPSSNVPFRVLSSKSFVSVRKRLSITINHSWVNVSRLDGFFQFVNTQDLHNHSPVNPILANITRGSVDVACNKSQSGSAVSTGVVLLLEDELTCSNEVAVQNYAKQAGIVSVVIMAKKSTPSKLSNIGESIQSDDESAFGIVGTMIEYNSGLVNALSPGMAAPCVLEYNFGKGQYFSVAHDFRILQIGSPINPILAVVSWQAEYLDYLHRKKQSETHLESNSLLTHRTTIFDSAQGSVLTTGSVGAKSNFTIPAGVGGVFNKAMISVKFGCPGNGDLECPIWDRIATVSAVCDTQLDTSFELTRWISPYRRSIGEWDVDVSHYLNFFTSTTDVTCTATLTGFSFGGMSEPWLSTVVLTFYNDNSDKEGSPTAVHKLPYTGGSYDTTYNTRAAPTNVTLTKGTTNVKLTALITGHGSDNYGCCEFLPTKHVFQINGEEFSVSFMDPLDKWGCTRKASLGVEPNGYGAWWFGRNGWCNGDIVRPVEFTAPVSGKDQIELQYRSLIYNTTTKDWNSPPCASRCGNIDMSAYLTEYRE
eukprot:TRINITY_DN2218_c1_g1_i1.p1 TRINITY_DN2218_c1_g1~~TRINITY_DN2218_c1_g1_i1.p1  ORF type:complete len:725 (+),score=106.83 TRINITY_DN2218_c1_g1_i1:89-2176(+)